MAMRSPNKPALRAGWPTNQSVEIKNGQMVRLRSHKRVGIECVRGSCFAPNNDDHNIGNEGPRQAAGDDEGRRRSVVDRCRPNASQAWAVSHGTGRGWFQSDRK